MDLERGLRPRERELLEAADSLSRTRFEERAIRYDREGSFPYENYTDLREAGLLALTVPEPYGGVGVSPLGYSLILERISRGCAATGLTFNMHSAIVSFLGQLASPAQRERFFGQVVREGKLFASITSEPPSSFRGKFEVTTRIARAPGGYRVNGAKHFCSLAGVADYYFTWARMEGSRTLREGLYTVLVEGNDPGVELEETWDTIAMRGTVSHTLHYRDCFVAEEDVVGEPGAILGKDLSVWTSGYVAVYLGIAQAALEYAAEYAKTRSFLPERRPIREYPHVQAAVGEMAVAVEAARLAMAELARVRAETTDKVAIAHALNRAKYLAAEAGVTVTQRALRMCGARALHRRFPLERHLRDALAGPVMPPTDDRCLETLGKVHLGLPAPTLEFVE